VIGVLEVGSRSAMGIARAFVNEEVTLVRACRESHVSGADGEVETASSTKVEKP
jgi:hypothetical protein